MEDCLFCKIAKGDIPSNKVYEDDIMLAFHDIAPEAPVHVLVIPKKHISSISALEEDDAAIVGAIMLRIKALAEELGIAEDGYRVVANTGKNGGQTVPHLHFHVIGGRNLEWPPG